MMDTGGGRKLLTSDSAGFFFPPWTYAGSYTDNKELSYVAHLKTKLLYI